MRRPYTKLPLTVSQHIQLLRSRGLVINNESLALHYIGFIGYYRLTGYLNAYRKDDSDEYLPGTSFEQVLRAYIFDRKLRHLFMDAIERIEIAVRSVISNRMAESHGPFWMTEECHFTNGNHAYVMSSIRKGIGKKPELNPHDGIKHYYERYSEPELPPSWLIMEVLSFSGVSRLYAYLTGQNRRPVAAEFDLQHDILESWLHSLSVVRNVCAHHGRLWNRALAPAPKIPKHLRSVVVNGQASRVFGACVTIQHMMGVIADESRWSERLIALVSEHADLGLNRMGIPSDWHDHPFWRPSQSIGAAGQP